MVSSGYCMIAVNADVTTNTIPGTDKVIDKVRHMDAASTSVKADVINGCLSTITDYDNNQLVLSHTVVKCIIIYTNTL